MTPREKVYRDALEEIVANEFMLMAHAKAREALAAADAIPDAPVADEWAAGWTNGVHMVRDLVDSEYDPGGGICEAIDALIAEGPPTSTKPVPSPMTDEKRAELIELMCVAWMGDEWHKWEDGQKEAVRADMGDVLDALIKAGAVR